MSEQHRGVVVASKGVVAASQPLAVSAGLGILQRGGSFADAAIAASAVLCVTEPYNSHLGGDAFLVVYDAGTGQTTALNGSGAAPSAAQPSFFPKGIPIRGMAAASVPGLVDCWFALHARWGTMPMQELLAPAIEYAERGFPAGHRYCANFANAGPLLRSCADTEAALMPAGRIPNAGDTIVQPDLAWTLRRIAVDGRDAFYSGEVAERIIRSSEANGGLFSLQDLATHRTQITPPIRTNYRGYTVHGQPPVSQGHILLEELNLVENFELTGMKQGGADVAHVQLEAKKLAFADRAAYLGDPDFVRVPVERLLSKDYARERSRDISFHRAARSAEPGDVEHDTTYFCVADANGNAVSFIQSVFHNFGCGVVAAGTGVLFNNRMTGFSLDPASPNVLAPGKRTAHTLNAYVVTREEAGRHALAFVGGTPGGDVQVQSNLQVLCNVIDFGMNPQEAIEAPRWQHSGGGREDGVGLLEMEDRFSPQTVARLVERGHRVERIGPWDHCSAYQLVAVHQETGAYMAGSDPRCDGHAAGF